MPAGNTRLPCLAVLLSGAVLAALPATAAGQVFVAANPGPIDGSGRELVFDLTGVAGPITAASLELDLDYSRVGDLDLRLVDASGEVQLPLAAFDGTANGAGVRGRYRFADDAPTTWLQAAAQAGDGILSSDYASRAFQSGLDGSQCLNLIGRYLEYDLDRSQPLRLRIARAHGGAAGAGRIDAARLRVETGGRDAIFRSGVEEPGDAIPLCRRASFDLLPNGATEGTPDSPLAILHYGGSGLAWHVRQLQPPVDLGPFAFGNSASLPYAGRFGGRSRLNIGFWDAATGSLNFSTGAGGRSLALDGDWTATEHYPIPGDYDGDGVTDLAMAFLGAAGGQPRWFARIRFSSTDGLRDFLVDPRASSASFTSGQIAFGQGQDSNLDGFDEITQYVRVSPSGPAMSMVVWNLRPEFPVAEGFSTAAWGQVGDILVLGRWIDAPGPGNRFSQMVVRRTPTGLDWYLFGNPTPTRWGLSDDQPLSINVDGDVRHDIAVFRPSSGRIHAIRSSDGVAVEIEAPGPAVGTPGFTYALGFLQGTLALPPF